MTEVEVLTQIRDVLVWLLELGRFALFCGVAGFAWWAVAH